MKLFLTGLMFLFLLTTFTVQAEETNKVHERVGLQDDANLWRKKLEIQQSKTAVMESLLREETVKAKIKNMSWEQPTTETPKAPDGKPSKNTDNPTVIELQLADFKLNWLGVSRNTGLPTAVISAKGEYQDVVEGDSFMGLEIEKVTVDVVTVIWRGLKVELRI